MTSPSPLLAQHQPHSIVALGCSTAPGLGETKTSADLLQDAGRVASRLPMLPAGQQVLLVFRQDRYAFVVALLACWSRGYSVCLPPNQRGATVTELLESGTTNSGVGVLLHDTGAAGHLSVPEILAARESISPLPDFVPPSPAVRVMTSGTMGSSVAWDKTAQQLFDEIGVLVQTFGIGPGLAYAVTVPPSHLYGLLFGVLLPLTTGGAFTRNTPLLPGEIAATVEETQASVLVTVPAHLRATRSLSRGSLASLATIFSSAGPLPDETARLFIEQHHRPITEIFGSTETGGIAWRQRQLDTAWQPLRSVQIHVTDEQLLVVSSPFTNRSEGPNSSPSFTTSDRVNLLPNGRFEHLGRQDGVVKIGGQRISVPAMEECLMQHPEVEDVAVLALLDEVRGHRLLAAVCAPPQLEDSCRAILASAFELSTLPRRFLFLDRLPREANGKLMRGRLLRLFGLNDAGLALSKTLTPEVERLGNMVHAKVLVPREYIGFSGHFDQYPVMAGATQIQHVVMPVLLAARPSWASPTELKRVKFTGRIEPGDTVDIELALGDNECTFALKKGDKICSSGTLSFGGPTRA